MRVVLRFRGPAQVRASMLDEQFASSVMQLAPSAQTAFLQSRSESTLGLCTHGTETELLIYVHLQRLTFSQSKLKEKDGRTESIAERVALREMHVH